MRGYGARSLSLWTCLCPRAVLKTCSFQVFITKPFFNNSNEVFPDHDPPFVTIPGVGHNSCKTFTHANAQAVISSLFSEGIIQILKILDCAWTRFIAHNMIKSRITLLSQNHVVAKRCFWMVYSSCQIYKNLHKLIVFEEIIHDREI